MSYELLAELDAAAALRGESRSAFIREACAHYVAGQRKAESIRRYMESYINDPESEEEATALEALAPTILEPEDW